MPPTANDRKVSRAKRRIKQFRESEQETRDNASSRSTGIRNVYKGAFDALADVEAILGEKPKK